MPPRLQNPQDNSEHDDGVLAGYSNDNRSTSQPDQQQERRWRETALHHANLIQYRKDIESLVVQNIEECLDLPSSADADPRCPSPSDCRRLTLLVAPFQPVDFDSLVQERNINRQCGYPLCAQSNRQENTKAPFRLLKSRSSTQQRSGGRSDILKVVETSSLERWCSDQCGVMATFLRSQLNTEPAWSREDLTGETSLRIFGQQDNQSSDALSSPTWRTSSLQERVKALSLNENIGSDSTKSSISRTTNAQERSSVFTPANQFSSVSNSIEGYVPSTQSGSIEVARRLMRNMDLSER